METVKRELLFISSQLPYPPLSGGVIKSFRLLNYFSLHYNVSLACPLKLDDAEHKNALQRALPNVKIYSFKTQVERSGLNWVKSLFQGKTLNEFRSFNASMAEQVKTLSQGANLIFVDHYEVFQYLPKVYSGKVILHTHNAEGQIWKRYAEINSNSIKRILIGLEARRIEDREKHYASIADLVLAAPNDIQFLKTANSALFVETYHLGNDELLKLPALDFNQTKNALMYVGTLTWEANVDGLLWFREQVWPSIVAKNPDTEFFIIGKNPDDRLVDWATKDPRVIVTGFVEDLDPYYQKARVFVVPLRFGSGMKVKILDAFYRGLPVSTTEIGIESIHAKHEQEVMVASNPEEMAHQISLLLDSKDLWVKMSRSSRVLAEAKYQWATHLIHLKNSIDEL